MKTFIFQELPAKSEEERLKHEKEYLKMLENIKKKEEQEAKMKKKQLELQLKNEEQQANAVKIWTQVMDNETLEGSSYFFPHLARNSYY